MSRIEYKYYLINTSYLAGLFDILILHSSYLAELCQSVFHNWRLFTNADTN